jgi:hypothetical protein
VQADRPQDVEVDGMPIGSTPIESYPISPGNYRIRAIDKATGKVREFPTSVEPRKTRHLSL